MKITALAYSNIALIKYWGLVDRSQRFPTNNSLSLNLSGLKTVTTVEFSKRLKADDITINGGKKVLQVKRVSRHLDRIRKLAGKFLFARVVSQNNFPASTGLSSSASGFAALTLAATKAFSLDLNQNQLSALTRLASGSACRSIPGGFVEWQKADSQKQSFAKSIYPSDFWKITDIVVVLGTSEKDIPTSKAMETAQTSPFFSSRIKNLSDKINLLKKTIKEKNFRKFGSIIEAEALELHAIMLTQKPSYIFWRPETVALLTKVRHWRDSGLPVFFTINTGHNLHLFCQPKDEKNLIDKLKKLAFVQKYIINYPAGPAMIIKNHLF